MDIIFLHGLKIECVIGVWEWERKTTQSVYIDLDMGWNITKAAETDDLEYTLSYKDVAKRVTQMAQEGKFNLVETMAERIAEVVIGEFDSPWCRVKVNKKGAVSSAKDVGVLIERGTKQS